MNHLEIALIRDPERRARALCDASGYLGSSTGIALLKGLEQHGGYWACAVREQYKALLKKANKPEKRFNARKRVKQVPANDGNLFVDLLP